MCGHHQGCGGKGFSRGHLTEVGTTVWLLKVLSAKLSGVSATKRVSLGPRVHSGSSAVEIVLGKRHVGGQVTAATVFTHLIT